MKTIKRIDARELKVGMYIADISNEWVPDTNLSRHGLIKKQEAINHILKLGVTELYIDTEKGEDCKGGTPLEEINQKLDEELNNIQTQSSHARTDTSFQEESANATKLHLETLNLVSQVMNDVKMGQAINIRPVEDVADGIAESIRRNQNALSCFTRMRHKDEYLIEHSFSVAVLMGILARSMGFSGDDLHQVVTGALLHDVGKIRVADEILHKPGSLDAEEWEEMKRHVQYGEEALDTTAGISTEIKQICAQHHERIDGTGYPRGLSGGAITLHGRMCSVVDVYDAITAHRVYHTGMVPTVAMKKIIEWSGKHLDRLVAYQFVACMSIYPAGTLVNLDNKFLALVLEANVRQQHLPVVKIVYDLTEGKGCAPRTINLAHSDSSERIICAVDPVDYKLTDDIFRSLH